MSKPQSHERVLAAARGEGPRCTGLLLLWALLLVLFAACLAPTCVWATKGIVVSQEIGGPPRGVAVDGVSGNVYVAVDGGQTEGIDVFDPEGDLVSNFGFSYGQFESVAVDQSDGALLASLPGGTIDAFSLAGAFEGEVVSARGEGAGEIGGAGDYLAFDPLDGRLIVADATNHRLDEFTLKGAGNLLSGEFVRAIGWGVISNSDEELQECTAITGCVSGLQGAGVGEFAAGGPSRVTVGPGGQVYAVDPANGRVEQFASGSAQASVYGEAALAGAQPSDVASEVGADRVYVAALQEGEQRVFALSVAGEQIGAPAGVGAGLGVEVGLATSPLDDSVFMACEAPTNSLVTFSSISARSIGVSEASDGDATLQARVAPGPGGLQTRFEYGQSDSYGSSVAASPGSQVGSTPVLVTARLQGLRPETTYHYRVVTTGEVGPGELETTDGADHTFSTQQPSGEPALLDGRAWEMVSPAAKHNAAFEAAPREGGVILAAQDGGAITYISHAAAESSPRGEPTPEWVQVLSRRQSTGWETKDLALEYGQEWGLRIGHTSTYLAFSQDLSLSLVEPPPGSAEPGSPEPSPYIRNQPLCEYGIDCQRPLVSEANVPPGTKFGGASGSLTDGANFVGATEDLQHVILRSEAALTPVGVEQGLYEWNAEDPADEELQLVSVLPEAEGGGAVAGAALGHASADERHAVSTDGSRVVWSTGSFLYMRDTRRDETVLLSEVQGGTGLGEFRPVFQDADAEDSKIFFTDQQALTPNSSADYEQPDLYVYEISSAPGEKVTGHVTDLTPVAQVGEHAGVQGMVLGASEDGTSVYFLATGVLAGSVSGNGRTAMVGADNLYVERYEGDGRWQPPQFIAGLSSEDGGRGGWHEQLSGEPRLLSARVSPDGQWLAFMSSMPLTGYDNHDRSSEARYEEVFVYHQATDELRCASCNPNNARPAGVKDPSSEEAQSLLVDRARVWETHWLSALLPGWTMYELNGSSVDQPRYLDDEGRLFFDDADGLARGDVNGAMDVYEYEPDGVGSCAQPEGCQALVSSGQSPEESVLLDASASGEDVFFLTAGELLPQEDLDQSYDVYDAHVCSSAAPCPAQVQPVTTCASIEECRVPGSALLSSLEEPPTATFSGSGNVVATPVVSTPTKKKPKQLSCRTRAKQRKNARKRAQALKRCAKQSKPKHPAREKPRHQARKKVKPTRKAAHRVKR